MILRVFALLLTVGLGQLGLAGRVALVNYNPEHFTVDCEQLFKDVFLGARELGIEGTRQALMQLRDNQIRQRETEIDRLALISEEMSSPCDLETLRLIKQLVASNRRNPINILPYLHHYDTIITDLCRLHLDLELASLIAHLTSEEKRIGEELCNIHSQDPRLFNERGELTAQWLLNRLDLTGVNQPSDTRRQIDHLMSLLSKNCGAIRSVLNLNYELVLIGRILGDQELDALNPQYKDVINWPKLCNKADLGYVEDNLIEQVAHRVYEIDSLAWTLAGASGHQDLVEEWRALKRKLYSLDSPLLQPFEVVLDLKRIIWIQESDYATGFRMYADNWDAELISMAQISKERCLGDFLAIFHVLKLKNSRSPVIVQFIKHVRGIQIEFCMSNFHQLLSETIGPAVCNQDNLSMLDRIIFLYRADSRSTSEFCGEPMIQAINRYLDSSSTEEMKDQRLKTLRGVCVRLRARLPPLLELFSHMEKNGIEHLKRDDAIWMHGLKICLGMEAFEQQVTLEMRDKDIADEMKDKKKKQKVSWFS